MSLTCNCVCHLGLQAEHFFYGLPCVCMLPPDLSDGCTNMVSKFVICGDLYGDERVYCEKCTERLKNPPFLESYEGDAGDEHHD